ncbi:MAG: 5-(carboxyamino)imidazole ribonucleotide mutase [Chloroflexi bacterium]|nr:MAG: 5-(carboxyamino)imidazole ribonucleotide mutase [Chloroflexota bacterium]
MGSQSDWPTMQATADTLTGLGIPFEARVLSAHRTPDETAQWAATARERGIRVLIAAAGGAAALPGAIAAKTTLPVIGVPMEGWALKGLDALLSMVQMPPGIPVGTVSIGKPGATNAALYAAAILAVSDEAVAQALDAYRAKRAQQILDNPDPSKAG